MFKPIYSWRKEHDSYLDKTSVKSLTLNKAQTIPYKQTKLTKCGKLHFCVLHLHVYSVSISLLRSSVLQCCYIFEPSLWNCFITIPEWYNTINVFKYLSLHSLKKHSSLFLYQIWMQLTEDILETTTQTSDIPSSFTFNLFRKRVEGEILWKIFF